MHNVKRFLEDSAYVALYITLLFFSNIKCSFDPSHEARPAPPPKAILNPTSSSPSTQSTAIDSSGKETVTRLTYFVVDSVEALSKFGTDAWERVVCVMMTGQAWQFRPHKWNELRQSFHNGM